MRRKTKIMIALGAISISTLALAACGYSGPYEQIDKEDADHFVSVRYDSNGGQFAVTDEVSIIDYYTLDVAQRGVKLLEPGSPRRGNGDAQSRTEISRAKHQLLGWYQERTPRVDEQGTPLDEHGLPCTIKTTNEIGEEILVSAEGKEQGYIYSDPWDFENDVFQIEDYQYVEGEYTKTLYAVWVSYTYVVYREGEAVLGGEKPWVYCGSAYFTPEYTDGTLELPTWSENGVMDYGAYPKVNNMTFEEAYLDRAKTQKITGSITNTQAYINYESGILENGVITIYSTWRDGVWYRVETAKQFVDNATVNNGCYEICADIDFTNENWPYNLTTGGFTGKIIGKDGHRYKISNIDFEQPQRSTEDRLGGLFGNISAEAQLKDIEFENVTYRLNGGSRMDGSYFGLLAGIIAEEADIKNVAVSGEILIGKVYLEVGTSTNVQTGYEVGLISGNLVTHGITAEITASSTEPSRRVEVADDGTVTIYYQ